MRHISISFLFPRGRKIPRRSIVMAPALRCRVSGVSNSSSSGSNVQKNKKRKPQQPPPIRNSSRSAGAARLSSSLLSLGRGNIRTRKNPIAEFVANAGSFQNSRDTSSNSVFLLLEKLFWLFELPEDSWIQRMTIVSQG